MEPPLPNRKLDMAVSERNVPEIVIDRVSFDDIHSIIRIDGCASGEPKPEFWHECYERQGIDTNSAFLVAKSGGEVAGYTIGTIKTWEFGAPKCGWVETITVAPEFRGHGIGTRLFDSIVAHFKASDILTVRTILHIDDYALMSFFRIQGMSAGPFIELEMQSD
jgi:ribosomal protein S18 acetylase RimI-like enzyme